MTVTGLISYFIFTIQNELKLTLKYAILITFCISLFIFVEQILFRPSIFFALKETYKALAASLASLVIGYQLAHRKQSNFIWPLSCTYLLAITTLILHQFYPMNQMVSLGDASFACCVVLLIFIITYGSRISLNLFLIGISILLLTTRSSIVIYLVLTVAVLLLDRVSSIKKKIAFCFCLLAFATITSSWTLTNLVERGITVENRLHYIDCSKKIINEFSYGNGISFNNKKCLVDAKNKTDHVKAYNKEPYSPKITEKSTVPVTENSFLQLLLSNPVYFIFVSTLTVTGLVFLGLHSLLLMAPLSLLIFKVSMADLIINTPKDFLYLTLMWLILFKLPVKRSLESMKQKLLLLQKHLKN
jgi:hypothetical protein